MNEHPGGRGAFLTRVDERRGDDPRHRLVEIRVGVDDHAVLASELGHHLLEVTLAGDHLGGGTNDLQAHRLRSRERDRLHVAMANERGADIALAGQQRDCLGRDSARAQRLHDAQSAPGRLLGGLEHDRVAGGERPRGHPAGDRDREVPRGDDSGDAARDVAQLVALPGDLDQLRAGRELDRAARVVLEKVDRLAHVGIGLGPGLGALAHLERGELEPPLAHPRSSPQQRLRPLLGRPRRPRLRARAGRGHRRIHLGLGGVRGIGDNALRLTRIASTSAVTRNRSSPPIITGTRRGSCASTRATASSSPARTGARRSSKIGSLAKAERLIVTTLTAVARERLTAPRATARAALRVPARTGTTRCSCSRAAA